MFRHYNKVHNNNNNNNNNNNKHLLYMDYLKLIATSKSEEELQKRIQRVKNF
jgi:hypothetical protein